MRCDPRTLPEELLYVLLNKLARNRRMTSTIVARDTLMCLSSLFCCREFNFYYAVSYFYAFIN